jgi:hypothetical protein
LDDSPEIAVAGDFTLKPRLSRPKGNPDHQSPRRNLFHFLVRRVLPARITKLFRLHPLGVLLLVFRRRVVAVFAIAALQRNDFPHESNSLLSTAC